MILKLIKKSKETIDLNDIEIDTGGELKQPENENNKDYSVKNVNKCHFKNLDLIDVKSSDRSLNYKTIYDDK